MSASRIAPQSDAPGQQQMAGLEAEERDARARLDRDAAHLAGLAVETGGHVDREHPPAGAGEGIDPLDDRSRGAVDVAREACAKQGVDHAIGAGRDRCPRRRGPGLDSARPRAPDRLSALRAGRGARARPRSRACAKRRAATKPSPPLPPGPQRTTIRPRDFASRAASSATARPARSMSAMPGVPAAMAKRSASPISAGVRVPGASEDRAWLARVLAARLAARKRAKTRFPSPEILLYRPPALIPDSSAGRAFDC